MKKSNSNLLTIGAIAAGAYALASTSKKNESGLQEIKQNQNFVAMPDNEQAEFIQKLKVALQVDPALKTLLKGAKGDAGSAGAAGAAGAAGDQIRHYGESLLRNGALELGSTQGWGGTVAMVENFKNKFPALHLTGLGSINSNDFHFLPNRLIKITGFAQAEETARVYILGYQDQLAVSKSTQSGSYGSNIVSNGSIVPFTTYIGGQGELGMNLAPNANKARIAISILGQSTYLKVSNLVVEYLSLGEPVPDTLAWLPVGQEVYDPTTGERGRFNGVDVDYYTMAV